MTFLAIVSFMKLISIHNLKILMLMETLPFYSTLNGTDATVFGQLLVDETSSQRIFLEYLSKEIRITYFTK